MSDQKSPKFDPRNDDSPQRPRWMLWLLVGVGTLFMMRMVSDYAGQFTKQLTYGELYQLVENNIESGEILEAKLVEGRVQGTLRGDQSFYAFVPKGDEELLRLMRRNVPKFDVQPAQTGFAAIMIALLPWIVLIGIMWLIMRSAQGGGRLLSFGKSKAKMIAPETKTKTTFDDVAGIDEAKQELCEIIDYLKDPRKFQRLGGKIPKGVLLIGPPGTGKTLLARAVAGEASVPFFSISGSDFVEMFVGVGASRVRDLFEQARRAAKQGLKGAIIFIDEIDAVGRQRFAGIGGGHDEREQTLNALLVEMDGFENQEGLILIAATNRPDVLDPALLRPGRFDRQVVVNLPDLNGREEILKVHTRNIKLSKDVDLNSIARQTPGFSGADLANLANEAALLAARMGKETVEIEEMESSIERVIAGPERKTRMLNEREKKVTAFHETGHSLVALFTSGTDPLHKVSIIPRGAHALGYTLQLPTEDRYTMTKNELLARIRVMMGGRAAEEIVFGEITTGAQNDIEKATELSRRMVCEFGMSERLGTLTYGKREQQMFLGRDLFEERNYSEQTAVIIDEEVRKIIDTAYQDACDLLRKHRQDLDNVANALLDREVLSVEDVKRIVGLEESDEDENAGSGDESSPERPVSPS